MLDDGCRFLPRFYKIIERSALHIYHSALTLTPPETKLFQLYKHKITNRMHVIFGVEKSWDPLLTVLQGHLFSVWSVTFSSDGSQLASASTDKTV
jgi:WD40 repeat protein